MYPVPSITFVGQTIHTLHTNMDRQNSTAMQKPARPFRKHNPTMPLFSSKPQPSGRTVPEDQTLVDPPPADPKLKMYPSHRLYKPLSDTMTDSTSDGMSISTPFYSTRRNIQTAITTTAVRVDPSLVSDRLHH